MTYIGDVISWNDASEASEGSLPVEESVDAGGLTGEF